MARGKVFLRLPGETDEDALFRLWRTNLTGRGCVGLGEEFIATEAYNYGRFVIPGGRKLRVRAVRVQKRVRFYVIHVEILADLTPPATVTKPLF